MSEAPFDPKTLFETYRNAFAPALKAQQESIKAMDRLGKYQSAVAGDYLEWSVAQANAAAVAQTPTELLSKQVELATALSEKMRVRTQEFMSSATEAQTAFTQAVAEATANVQEVTKQATAKAVDAGRKVAA